MIKLLAWAACTLLSYLLGRYLPPGPLATYAPLMISYHLFLAVLVLTTDRKEGLSLSVGSTIFTHLACVGVLFCFTFGRAYIPFADIIRYFIPGLAPFETKWLFSGGKKKSSESEGPPRTPDATAEEYQEFIQYLGQKNRRYSRAGHSIQEEFASWLAHRPRKRQTEAPGN